MGYDQNTVPDIEAGELCFNTHKHTSQASRAILYYFFEEQWTQNHPQTKEILIKMFNESL